MFVILQFNTQLYTLISNGKTTLVVFINGSIHPLKDVIQKRKALIPEEVVQSKIKSITYKSFEDTFYIGLMVEGENNFCWTTYNENGMKFTKIDISRDELNLRGHCFHQSKDKIVLLTICKYWSLIFHNINVV